MRLFSLAAAVDSLLFDLPESPVQPSSFCFPLGALGPEGSQVLQLALYPYNIFPETAVLFAFSDLFFL